jgi:hypothetical protein
MVARPDQELARMKAFRSTVPAVLLLSLATPAMAQDPEGDPADTTEPETRAEGAATTEPHITEEAAPGGKWYETLQVNGFVSFGYTLNVNRPFNSLNGLRWFDPFDNSLTIDVAELVLQKTVSNPNDVGFRIDLEAGATIPVISASVGLFRADPTELGSNFDLQQAYVSWIAGVGNGLRLDFGKFITHVGAEVIEGYDGYNDNYSRGFLFGLAIPFTHTGVRATYPFSDTVTGMFMIVNGWDNTLDTNDMKTFGAQVAIAAGGMANIYLNWVGGPEQVGEDGNWRNLLDVVAILTLNEQLKLMFNADLGFETFDIPGGESDTAKWFGLAAYLTYKATDTFQISLRAEFMSDADAARTGLVDDDGDGVNLIGLTATPCVTLGEHVVLRADLRLDVASVQAFATDEATDPSKTQFTIGLNALAFY